MTEILLYGEVGWDFDALWLNSALAETEGDVTLRVHSPGGDVFEGVAISNTIRRAQAQGRSVTAAIDGLCASAASYMCLPCDRILAGPGAVFMVHPPSGLCWGTADDMRSTAQSLDVCHATIRNLYQLRTGHTAEQVDEVMRSDTWMTAEDAVAWGLADAIDPDAPDLSDVDGRWAGVSTSSEYAAFALAHPAMDAALGEHRERALRFKKALVDAPESGFGAVDYPHRNIPSETDDGPDESGEAPETPAGEAPAFAVANGHIYPIGNRKG